MSSKDVLKEAIRAFDGTAIIVSHDREFLDGLVTKVYEFGGGKVKEYLGGIYDWIETHPQPLPIGRGGDASSQGNPPVQANYSHPLQGGARGGASGASSYAEHKEQQRRKARAEKAVKASEQKIEQMEGRLKELDQLLSDPANACDMTLVTEYTDTKRALDEEVERWEQLSEELELLTN